MTHRPDLLEPADHLLTAIPSPQDKPHRQVVVEALGVWVDAHCDGGRERNPLQRLHAVEWVGKQFEVLLTAERRRAALLALGSGQSLAAVGRELGLSRWALAKRWPDLIEQARPYRWLSTNDIEWPKALVDLLELEEPAAQRLQDEQREALARLREVINRFHTDTMRWWVLVDTPDLARAILQHEPSGEFRHHLVHDWLHALLADYDRTRFGEKPKPQAEVTRAAVHAATQQRLGGQAG